MARGRLKFNPTKENKQFWTEFLDLYRRLPSLWRVKISKHYKHKNLRTKSFQMLIEKMKELHPSANRTSVRLKIKNLRRQYNEEEIKVRQAKERGKTYIPVLWYYDNLSFLRDQDIQEDEIASSDLKYTPQVDLAPSKDLLLNHFASVLKDHPERIKAAQSPVLDIRCKGLKGQLVKARFGSGTRGRCIMYEEKWWTPAEFEVVAGGPGSRDWKRSIKFYGEALLVLIEGGYLNVHAVSCACTACLDDDVSVPSTLCEVEINGEAEYQAGTLNTLKKIKNYLNKEYQETLTHAHVQLNSNNTSTYCRKINSPIYVLARIWAEEFRNLSGEQQIYARKGINDILFEGRLETLHRNSITFEEEKTFTTFSAVSNDSNDSAIGSNSAIESHINYSDYESNEHIGSQINLGSIVSSSGIDQLGMDFGY